MQALPLRFRRLPSGQLLFADDAGGFFVSDETFLGRYASDALTDLDRAFLLDGGHGYERQGDAAYTSFAYRWAGRRTRRRELVYAILVPTLRCNLTCDYCQVSRAPERALRFDWTEQVLGAVLSYLDRQAGDEIKIEFQGGEPLLRLDLLERVRSFCRRRFARSHFVVCTNLQSVSPEAWEFLEAPDTFVSTSLDGDAGTHRRQRTHDAATTRTFFANLDEAFRRLGIGKISALPTVDMDDPPDPARADRQLRVPRPSIDLSSPDQSPGLRQAQAIGVRGTGALECLPCGVHRHADRTQLRDAEVHGGILLQPMSQAGAEVGRGSGCRSP